MTQNHSRSAIVDPPRISPLVRISAVALILVQALTAWAAGPPSYPVIRVVDGDTLLILYQGKKEKVRLLNVDTPESVHPNSSRNTLLGKKASAYTRSRLAGKRICLEFEEKKRGRYGRLLAYVILDKQNFNLELVRQGWSPYYTKYGISPHYHDKFLAAQSEARAKRLNIWQSKANTQIAVAGILHGNIKSKIFHAQSCRYFNCAHCTRSFSSRNAALGAGFSPCGHCSP